MPVLHHLFRISQNFVFATNFFLLKLMGIVVIIPESVTNDNFFSLQIFFKALLGFRLLWAMVSSLLGCSYHCNHEVIYHTQEKA